MRPEINHTGGLVICFKAEIPTAVQEEYGDFPVGRVICVRADDPGHLWVKMEFDRGNPLARLIASQLQERLSR